MKIIRGKTKPKGLRIIVYGVPNAGKTTLLSKLPNNLFIDFEDGTHGLDVAKLDKSELPKSYDGMKAIFAELKRDHQGFEHVTIDTADKCELNLTKKLAEDKGVEDIFAVNDYGRTVSVHNRSMADILDKANALVNTGFDVIVIAHDTARKVEPLEKNDGKTYDHVEMRLSKTVTKLFTDWADWIIYVGFKTFVVKGDKGSKDHVEGGTRWAYNSYCNDFDAKHRACIEVPDDCSLDKLTKMLPDIIAKAVDRANGCDVEEVTAKAEAPASEPKKEETKEEFAPSASSETELQRTIRQYGLTEDVVINFPAVVNKFKERYGKNTTEVAIADWPDDFAAWVIRGITAEKIKA